jgi:hypothetical protein
VIQHIQYRCRLQKTWKRRIYNGNI